MQEVNLIVLQEANANIVCRAQPCPQVLRKTVVALFPHRNLEHSELSVITISLKPNLKDLYKNRELETERLAQTVSLYCLIIHKKSLVKMYNKEF